MASSQRNSIFTHYNYRRCVSIYAQETTGIQIISS